MIYEILVPGVPVAQPRQRHRVLHSGGRAFASNYTPKDSPVNAFKAACQLHAQMIFSESDLLDEPIGMDLVFVLPRPKSVPKRLGDGRQRHVSRPDVDNLRKAVQDALEGIVYRNDSLVCESQTIKYRAAAGEQCSTTITIRTGDDLGGLI